MRWTRQRRAALMAWGRVTLTRTSKPYAPDARCWCQVLRNILRSDGGKTLRRGGRHRVCLIFG